MSSLFFQLHQIDAEGSRFTAMEREMLRLTLEANPGVTLGAAVQDVFDYLKIKIKKARLEAICARLIWPVYPRRMVKPRAAMHMTQARFMIFSQ